MRALKTLRRYRRLLARYLRPQWPRMVLLTLVLLSAIAVQVATPFVTGRFIDRATTGAPQRVLIELALLTIGLALAGQGLAVVETYVAEQVSWSATNALRVDLVAHLLRLDAGFHAARTPGELIERVDGDVTALAHFFSRFVVAVVGNLLLMVGVLALLIHLDWRIGVGLSVFAAVALTVLLWIRARATPYSAEERQASAEFYGFLGETLTAREDVRASGADAWVLRRGVETMRQWLHATLAAGIRGYAMIASSEAIFGIGAALAFGLACVLFNRDALTLGSVYLIFRYTEMLRQPAEQIRDEVQDLQRADAGMGRVEELLAAEPKLADGSRSELPPGPLSIELDQVAFSYADGTPVLRDLSVAVAPGRVLGVVGRTGAGKTTFTRLIPRLYDPDAGVVRLGGVDLREVRLAGVRTRIGVVTQDVQLYAGSLRQNLTMFDETVSDDRLIDVLESLGLGDWLRALPAGVATPLSAAGVSAGQAQLLACARIFLTDPDVIVLDEASSRLDPATERLLHEALRRLLQGRTGIIVAHRLATIAFADDILVLEAGRAREHGPRLALAADPNSRFAELLRSAGQEVPA